jgi:signal transduction histidine kinase
MTSPDAGAEPAAAAALETAVKRDLLRSHFLQSPVTAAGASSMCLLMAVAAWRFVPHAIVGLFLALTLSVQGFRLATGLRFRRRPPAVLDPRFWGPLAAATAGASGLSIGLGCVLLHVYGGEPMLAFAFIMLTGLNSGGVGNNSYHPPALRAFIFLSSPVFIVYLLGWVDSPNVTIVAIALAVHSFITLAVIGRDQMRTLRSSVRLRYEKDDVLEQLRQQTAVAEAARQRAEEANEEKTRFFASASHDLRQPVHALNLYASLLQKSATDGERRELLARIGNCIHTLDDLFNALLTVSRAEAASREANPRGAVSLEAAIDNAVTQLAPKAAQKGLELRRAPTSLWVRGDAIAVERILGNLLSNAVAYSERGKVLVGVRRRGASVELQVLDTGIGIAEEHHRRIFDEFFQVANPGRDSAKGFGLGLVIVQRLCHAFSYGVHVRSVVGRGSCFSVAMPVAEPAAQDEEAAPEEESAQFSRPVSALLVDDDAVIRDAIERVFRDWGVNLQIAASSEQALDLVATTPAAWSCLLLDLRLGGRIDGLELAGRLRERLGRALPVALLTGEAEGPPLDKARALGYTVLRKPVKLMRLRAFLAAAATAE